MWQSLQQMPFIKFSHALNMSESNNMFLNANMYYQEIEEDLVVFYNEVDYKQKVTYNHYRRKDIAPAYYCLTVILSETTDNHSKTIINDFHFNGLLWILHKPNVTVKDFHFKNSRTKTLILYFTKNWLKRYMAIFPEENTRLQHFIHSGEQSIGLNFIATENGMSILDKGAQRMKTEVSQTKKQLLTELVFETIAFFKTTVLQNIAGSNHLSISNANQNKVLLAEALIMQNIYSKFPGIDFIAEQVGLSSTKLKTQFKTHYGTSLFQYHRSKQLTIAKQLIAKQELTIKDIGLQFGYENASKFSAAFKQQHGVSPSDLQKEQPN